MPQRIDKIGVEIEGGWEGEPYISPFKDISLIADGSIDGQNLKTKRLGTVHIGEAVSPPFPFEKLKELEEWIISHYPSGVNETCAFHIHVSLLSDDDYSTLMSWKFTRRFLMAAVEWGKDEGIGAKSPFWERVFGRNLFCTKAFNPDAQAAKVEKRHNDKERYGVFNFCHGVHHTVECRVFPAFATSQQAVSALKFLLKFIQKFLDKES